MFKEKIPYIAWIQALIAALGSLYFSEVLLLPPCVLCWYQRIFMYPIVIVAAVCIMKRNRDIASYVLPLSVPGLLIAAYHNLLYYRIIPESITPCRIGISCTTRQIEWLGFITIPLLSLIAFTVITLFMIMNLKNNKSDV